MPPQVSICIPLYNKAAHLASVLDSILNQQHTDLEVVLSDNGSDDGSSQIAQDFAGRDSRVRVHRIEKTITLNENWRLVMRLAAGQFIKVHSADDPLHPDFLPQMLQPMLDDPAVEFTVCREEARFINVEGKLDTQEWIDLFETTAENCRQLTQTPDEKERASLLVEQNAFHNRMGNIYKILFRPVCLPAERWKQLSASYPMPQSFADWDFLIRLFLQHRGRFVDRVLSHFEFDPQSPFIKLQSNAQMQLAADLQDFIMPLTVLTDPTLRPLRDALSTHERDKIFARMGRELRTLINQAAEIDAAARTQSPGAVK